MSEPIRYLIQDDVHERIVAERERAAFIAGAIASEVNLNGIGWDTDAVEKRRKRAEVEATRRYPL